jgi:hypothetical protein
MLLRTKQKLQAARAELGKLNEGIQAAEVAVLDAEGKRLGTMVWGVGRQRHNNGVVHCCVTLMLQKKMIGCGFGPHRCPVECRQRFALIPCPHYFTSTFTVLILKIPRSLFLRNVTRPWPCRGNAVSISS